MKRYLFPLLLLSVFGTMLALPGTVFKGASTGLLLWFRTVLPTLFPFLIITGLLIGTNAISIISKIIGPVCVPLFGVSPHASFAVLGGFLCGYPMGAKITSDLIQKKYISHAEGEYLLSFCNNTSPMFIVSYIVWQTLQKKEMVLPSLLILYAAPILSSFLFRRYYVGRKKERTMNLNNNGFAPIEATKEKGHIFQILDTCIMDSCEIITKVGGYIIVFSILLALLGELPFSSFAWTNLFLPSLEITAGVSMLSHAGLSFANSYVLIMALTSFGGICAIFQTQCMVQKNGFLLSRYIIEKLITAMVTSLFSYIYITVFFK